MRSMVKWVWTVFLLGVVNVMMGYYVGHMSINENPKIPTWFRFPQWMTENITYTVARTWHLQSAVFFVAGSLLAGGLFLAPTIIGGRRRDPPFQKCLCDLLYLCVLIIVAGSFVGELAAVHQYFESLDMSYWFGHQGYEYVDLGRFWQWFLTIGIFIWLGLMVNGVWPALLPKAHAGDMSMWHLTWMLTLA